MINRVVLALIVGAAAISIAGPQAGRTVILTPVSSGSCITMEPDQQGGYTLTNSCQVCRTAVVSWCDGEGHLFEIKAGKSIHIEMCRGFQSLLTDTPCERLH